MDEGAEIIPEFVSLLVSSLVETLKRSRAAPPMQNQPATTQIIPLLRDSQLHVLQVAGFITACKNLLPVIKEGWRVQLDDGRLPTNVVAFLCGFLRMTVEEVDLCWRAVNEEVIRAEAGSAGLQHLMDGMWASRDGLHRLAVLNLRKSI